MLLGQNGAGKSTLIKALYRRVPPGPRRVSVRREAGPDCLAGRRAEAGHCRHLSGVLARTLSGCGAEHLPWPGVSRTGYREASIERGCTPRHGASSPRSALTSIRERRRTSLVLRSSSSSRSRRRSHNGRAILVMDEPTATLSDPEIERLFALIRKLKQARRRDCLHLASAARDFRHRRPCITVLRDGHKVADTPQTRPP